MVQKGICNGGGDDSMKRGTWSPEEDAILIEYINKNGVGNWNAVEKFSGLSRDAKSCRFRWMEHLRPDLKKGPLSPQEERRILELHACLGNKWSRIATELPGRTDNEIKNYWNSRKHRLQRKARPMYSYSPDITSILPPLPPLKRFKASTLPASDSLPNINGLPSLQTQSFPLPSIEHFNTRVMSHQNNGPLGTVASHEYEELITFLDILLMSPRTPESEYLITCVDAFLMSPQTHESQHLNALLSALSTHEFNSNQPCVPLEMLKYDCQSLNHPQPPANISTTHDYISQQPTSAPAWPIFSEPNPNAAMPLNQQPLLDSKDGNADDRSQLMRPETSSAEKGNLFCLILGD